MMRCGCGWEVTFFPTITSLPARPEPSGGGQGKVGRRFGIGGDPNPGRGGESQDSVLFDDDGGDEACGCWLTRWIEV